MTAARRARLLAPRELRFEALELDPGALAPHELYAETEYSAVSVGTEKAAYMGMPPLRPGPVYPRLVGYCNAARIVAVGAGVADLVPGDRVLTHQSHQSAFVCAAADVLATIPASLPSRAASVAYIAHLGLTALARAGLRAGESVVVQGLGPIGLATVALARALGAGAVIAVGNAGPRLRKARALGADEALDAATADLPAQVRAANGGLFADLVVTSVNAWSAWPATLGMVREFGRIAVLGFPGRGEALPAANPFDPALFYSRQVTIISAGMAGGPGPWGEGDRPAQLHQNMRRLVALATEGRLPLDALITDEVPWNALGSIYDRAAAGDKEMIVPVLRWSEP